MQINISETRLFCTYAQAHVELTKIEKTFIWLDQDYRCSANYLDEITFRSPAIIHGISACMVAQTRGCRRLLKRSKQSQDENQDPEQASASVWLLLLQRDNYLAALILNYLITPMVWSNLNAVNKETKWFLFTHPEVWDGFDIDLTQLDVPKYSRLMDDLLKYAKSVTIMQNHLSASYWNQTNLRLRWLHPAIYFVNIMEPIISEWPLIRKFRYEVRISDMCIPSFVIGVVDYTGELSDHCNRTEIGVHIKLPHTFNWKINGITVQSINPLKVPGTESEEGCMSKNEAIVGIELDETSINFVWNGQHIDSMSASFISKDFNDHFHLFIDASGMNIEPVDALLNTTT